MQNSPQLQRFSDLISLSLSSQMPGLSLMLLHEELVTVRVQDWAEISVGQRSVLGRLSIFVQD